MRWAVIKTSKFKTHTHVRHICVLLTGCKCVTVPFCSKLQCSWSVYSVLELFQKKWGVRWWSYGKVGGQMEKWRVVPLMPQQFEPFAKKPVDIFCITCVIVNHVHYFDKCWNKDNKNLNLYFDEIEVWLDHIDPIEDWGHHIYQIEWTTFHSLNYKNLNYHTTDQWPHFQHPLHDHWSDRTSLVPATIQIYYINHIDYTDHTIHNDALTTLFTLNALTTLFTLTVVSTLFTLTTLTTLFTMSSLTTRSDHTFHIDGTDHIIHIDCTDHTIHIDCIYHTIRIDCTEHIIHIDCINQWLHYSRWLHWPHYSHWLHWPL